MLLLSLHLKTCQDFKGTKDDESDIFRAETLKIIKFPPEIFFISFIVYIFATAN